ncbi:MAG: hypothetical protein H8D34_27595 [Chloroflexi bacterium]|nr:hypothetical protein [Chloroflexota bacterium]
MSIMQALMMGTGGAIGVTSIEGKLFAWGEGSFGQLGLGDVVTRSSPVQVGAGTDWTNKFICDLYSTWAIKSDGTLWAWGLNSSGQLGVGDVTARSSPTQIGVATNWAFIHGGCQRAGAVNSSGELWTWGQNSYGQLGLNDATNRSTPVQVGSDTDWAACSFGKDNTIFIKTTGAIYSTGLASQGSLGDGQVATNRSSPVQIGAATDWLGITNNREGYTTFSIRSA